VLIFTTDRAMQRLCAADACVGDGTFKSRPLLYGQAYTLNHFSRERLIPDVWILSTRRTMKVYRMIFDWFKEHASSNGSEIKWKRFKSDFEAALHSVVTALFNGTYRVVSSTSVMPNAERLLLCMFLWRMNEFASL
jgi:hypothetical protein